MARMSGVGALVLQTSIWSDQPRIGDRKTRVNWSDQLLTSGFFGRIIGAELSARAAAAAMRVCHRRQQT
jgi:hypothetical protein